MRLREWVFPRSLLTPRKCYTMATELVRMLQWLMGLLAGAIIGAAFGMIQEAARRRNEKLQQNGKLQNAWGVMPGMVVRRRAVAPTLRPPDGRVGIGRSRQSRPASRPAGLRRGG